MGTSETKTRTLTMSTVMWYAIFVWFASSLFSQSLYMAFNGVPYDAVALLQNLGPVYYIVLAIELVVWISLGSLLVKKVVTKTRDRVQPVALAA
jgi:cation transport ATPase